MHYECPLNDVNPLPSGYMRANRYVIRHSGHSYGSTVRESGGIGAYIWPIEELTARRKFKPTVKARIERLNPHGKAEGSICRGWFFHAPRARALHYDCAPLREYVAKWGTKRGAEIVYKQGRHKFVSQYSLLDGPR